MPSSRSRSASPAREEPKPKKPKIGGFKWKEKRPRDSDQAEEQRDSGTLERGYRNRSPRRDSYRDKEREREREREREEGGRRRERSPRRDRYDDGEREDRPRRREDEPSNQTTDTAFTTTTNPPAVQDKFPSSTSNSKPPKDKSKPKKPKPPTITEPMIIVNINDRLGTKAAIPCLASDSIKAFKAVVAAHIGRQPHEIMLKRQGERPFKDQLTLADYGVSNGVQLDLELDTGD